MLKNLVSILVLLIPGFVCKAQNGDKIMVSAKYQVVYFKNKAIVVNDICQLDIGQNGSYFYSLGKLAHLKFMIEKRKQAEQSGALPNFEESDFRHDLFEFNTIKDYKSRLITVVERVGTQQLGAVKDTLNTISWKITNDKKIINNLQCRKAEAKKAGVLIVVWFCSDISLQEGPLYYYGLPGLIVDATNSLGWHASLTSIEYNKDIANVIKIRSYVTVTQTQLSKAKKNANAAIEDGASPNGDYAEKVKN